MFTNFQHSLWFAKLCRLSKFIMKLASVNSSVLIFDSSFYHVKCHSLSATNFYERNLRTDARIVCMLLLHLLRSTRRVVEGFELTAVICSDTTICKPRGSFSFWFAWFHDSNRSTWNVVIMIHRNPGTATVHSQFVNPFKFQFNRRNSTFVRPLNGWYGN